jgi:hypothetical protein
VHDTQAAQVDGRDARTGEWRTLMPKMALQGHAVHRYSVAAGGAAAAVAASDGLIATTTTTTTTTTPTTVSAVRVFNFPDGGLSRLGLFGLDLPAAEQQRFPAPGATFVYFSLRAFGCLFFRAQCSAVQRTQPVRFSGRLRSAGGL